MLGPRQLAREIRSLPRRATAAGVALVALLDSAAPVFAQATWTSATTGTWNVADNWSTGIVPGNGNTTAAVLSNTSASYTVTYDGGNASTMTSLTASNAAGRLTTIDVNSTGFNFGTSTLTNARINVNSGGSMATSGSMVASGSANIVVQGGTFTSGGNLGLNGTVNVTLTSGSIAATGGFFFPTLTMSGGNIRVTGGQSGINGGTISGGTYTDTNSTNVMYVRSGQLTLSGSGQITTAGFYVLGSGQTMQVSSGSFTVTGNTFMVGNNNFTSTRTGYFNQSGGSVTSTSATGLIVGNASGALAAGSDYAYVLSGGTFAVEKITLAAGIYIGSGTNRFTMSGGTLNLGSGGIVIGSASGSKLVQLSGGTIAAKADWSSSVAMSLLTSAGTGTATFKAADSSDVARTITLSGILGGSGALAKTGAGVLALQNANTYSGATTVSAGRLQIDPAGSINSTSGITVNGSDAELRYNSSTALSKPLTLTQGTLSGTGTIGTAVTVGSGAILSPGNSPGSQSYTSGLTLGPGGTYAWEINDWSGSAGTNYDQLVVSGGPLDVTATSGSTHTIRITGLTAGNAVGAVPNFNNAVARSFTIATAGSLTGFAADKFTLDSAGSFSGANALANGGFTIGASGNELVLNYIPSAVYDLSAAASAVAIHVGGTSTITATVTSNTTTVTNPDSLAYGGLALSGGLGSLSSTSGTLAGGQSGGGSAVFTGASAGAFTFNPSVTTATNATIGTTANAGSTSGVTVTVYNLAAANSISGTVNFGTVLVGTSLTQALTISNTAPGGSYTEKLDAAFGTLSGGATTNGGSISLLAAGGTNTAMSVSLASGSAGAATGSAQVNFTSNGLGTSGLGTTSLGSQTVSLVGTVLDRAVASFTSGSTATGLLLDFGSVQQNAIVSPLGFDLRNLMQTNGYTADLALLSIVSGTNNSGAITTTLTSTFNNLAAGTFNSYTTSLATDSPGAFTNVYTLTFKSVNGGTVYGDDPPQTLTLTVQGFVVVPEPGALAIAGVGLAAVGWSLARRRRRE